MINDNSPEISPETYLCHGPFQPHDFGGVVNPPVYHASTVLFRNVDELEARQKAVYVDAEDDVMYYGRFGTPTNFYLQQALAKLEGGHRSALVPSGLAACTSAVMALVKAGDHILVSSSVYGPIRKFIDTVLADFNVTATYFDPWIGENIDKLFCENTTLVFTESPGSLTFEIQDIPAICAAAHANGALVVMDNTWATPLFFKPFEHGVDVSVHAATKYIVGHSDAQMGLITATEGTWRRIRDYIIAYGLHAAPDDVYLAQRGLRTMAVRLERHQRSAIVIAKWLAQRPEVEQVLHPALPSCPGHDLWRRDFKGSSGLFSAVIKSKYCKESFRAFIDKLSLFGIGFSWGGFESLVVPFDPYIDRPEFKWPYEGHAFRLQIGLEETSDLIRDLETALECLIEL